MTPAVKLLDKLKIAYQLHQYHHDESAASYGLEAAEKLAVDAKKIFKTLVVEMENKSLAVAIVPVENQLTLKNVAKALKCKKVTMADPKRVQTTTGYVLGGVSPLGQKKRLKTVIDKSSQQFSTIFVSGGKRGLEIEISPNDLILVLSAIVGNIKTNEC
ncbi:Cys-tRNA(Pro) deacylase [Thalassotalea castellviae]|uniref:Cys-tRNA(Pro)/Cys-tRNA(Cys) deacylase n=1 Tax=Thalassotalea castellviae TaxID=3075612 RepID=A0ABU3A4Y7_9GAMM|nr:Cys-tRNA(Pro) deacylase [Thalassotalea sp. W431]MDT0605241.1 Cys-tRNA(Pro) deacylase [Thalassotalea sp. W431]